MTAHSDAEILTAIHSAMEAGDWLAVAALLHMLGAQAPEVAREIVARIRAKGSDAPGSREVAICGDVGAEVDHGSTGAQVGGEGQ